MRCQDSKRTETPPLYHLQAEYNGTRAQVVLLESCYTISSAHLRAGLLAAIVPQGTHEAAHTALYAQRRASPQRGLYRAHILYMLTAV